MPEHPHTRLQEGQYEPSVPAVGDRIAQPVAAMALGPRTEAIFHEDSYGYRPRKGALDAVGRCRERCWERDWVIDLDIRKFFDSVPWDLMVKAVQANVTHEQRWASCSTCAGGWPRPSSCPMARWQNGTRGPRKEVYEQRRISLIMSQCRVMRSAGLPGLVGA